MASITSHHELPTSVRGDYILAHVIYYELLEGTKEDAKGVLYAIAYLFTAARDGHTGIYYASNGDQIILQPKANELFGVEELIAIAAFFQIDTQSYLCELLRGIERIIDLVEGSSPTSLLARQLFVYSFGYLYLYRCWDAQNATAHYVKQIYMRPDTESNKPRREHSGTFLELLYPHQRLIADQLLHEPFLLLQGGPGTGKTHTVACTLAHWLTQHSMQGRLLITAPTGKAVAHLQRNLLKYLPPNEDLQERIETGTLHRILNRYRNTPLEVDLVIIDESSMVELEIFSRFLNLLPNSCRLILVGDYNQLPPVEGGNPFEQLVLWSRLRAPTWLAELTQCIRVESSPLLTFAQKVLAGDSGGALQELDRKDPSVHLELTNFSDLNSSHLEGIISQLATHFICQGPINDEQLEELEQFRILSSLRQGSWGSEGVNHAILVALGKKFPFRKEWVIPILITENRPELDLYNGDTGFLIHHPDYALSPERLHRGQNRFLFPSKSSGGSTQYRSLPPFLVCNFEVAFCISIHKSQGSEFKKVALLLPEGSERFGRQLLYTGITRAKKQLTLYGSSDTLVGTIQERAQRTPTLIGELQRRFADYEQIS